MKAATFLLVVAAFACAQVRPQSEAKAQPAAKLAPPPAVAPAGAKPNPPSAKIAISRQNFKTLEDQFNLKLTTFNPAERVYMLGMTRGLYLQGFGAVFTTELDLIQSPTTNPFHQQILAEEVVSTHMRKLKQLPLIKKAIADQFTECAKSMQTVPLNEQIVFAVRLDYQPWEDTVGLPGTLLLRADRKSAMAGDVKVEEQ